MAWATFWAILSQTHLVTLQRVLVSILERRNVETKNVEIKMSK
jgi:hypothetical protein